MITLHASTPLYADNNHIPVKRILTLGTTIGYLAAQYFCENTEDVLGSLYNEDLDDFMEEH